MCIGALPLGMKALGGSTKDAALTAISPALGIMSALSHKKKPKVVGPTTTTTAGVVGPSPSGV